MNSDKKTIGCVAILDQNTTGEIEKQRGHLIVQKKLKEESEIALITITQCYGVTLTFKKKYKNEDPLWLHKEARKMIEKWKDINFILRPEFTKAGQLHYHGIIYNCYQVIMLKYIQRWRRKFGFVKTELELKHKHCFEEADDQNDVYKRCKEHYPKCCWYHYMWKDAQKVGLSTIYKIN